MLRRAAICSFIARDLLQCSACQHSLERTMEHFFTLISPAALALAFASHLAEHPGLHLLAAGTDGADGNSSCAGAMVSMYTALKADKMGFDMQQEIDKAYAGIVLMATNYLVHGAHSNTNVMDIVIAYIME